MVEISKKIGPWLPTWDPGNIQSWGGVLIALDISSNQYRIVGLVYNSSLFHGELPIELTQLPELRYLGISGDLSGPIPSWIGDLSKLEELSLGENYFEGSIPPEIGKLKNLKRLVFYKSSISGEIPKEIGNLKNLERFVIFETGVSGSIPKELANLDLDKVSITLDKNKLSGTFPLELSPSKRQIGCSDNNIESFPFDYWKIEDAIIPDLQGNRLSGEVPEWVRETEKWEKKKGFVDRQQEGYGYTNIN
jgi:hypothetical protein